MASSSKIFGLTVLVQGKHKPLPLKGVSVEADINGYVLGLSSTLQYLNDSPDPAEVLFRFPLEQSHAVVGLTAVIDGRRIKAQLKEKEQARADYDDAIASGQSAALAEEKTGDIFSITLGNLPPGKDAEIQMQLVGELPIDAEGCVRFSLPSILKPRYTPTGSSDPLAPVPSGEGGQVEHGSLPGVKGFRLNVSNAHDIAEVTSPTHPLSVTRDDPGDKLTVSLSEAIDKDLVVMIKHSDPHTPKALVEGAPKDAVKEGFMSSTGVMVNFFPNFESVEAACEFVFLVDRSGSMSGGFIKSARETLILFLKSLPEGCSFNIIGFGSSFVKLFPDSVPYSQESLDKATQLAERMDADLGGTELLSPLESIFRQKPLSGLPRQVFVLTDGAVSNTHACIQKVKQNDHNARCFTFGIGSGASTELVEGLARAGNGTAEFVKAGERLQPKVVRSLKRALQPAVTDVSLEFKLPSSGQFEVLKAPQKLPPVFNNEKLVAYGILKHSGAPKDKELSATAILKGIMVGKKISHSVSFKFNPATDAAPVLPTIHHLAAKALLKDWQDENKSKTDIVKLSVESSVISSHTAFIAVDEESSEVVSGAMKTWDIQAQRQQQYQYHAQQQYQYHAPSMVRRCCCCAAPMALRSAGGYRGGGGGGGAPKGMKMKKSASPVAKKRRAMDADLLTGGPPPPPMNVMSSGPPPAPPGAAIDDLLGFDSFNSFSASLAPPPPPPAPIESYASFSQPLEKDTRRRNEMAPKAPATHSAFISIQQAAGSWKFDSTLFQLLGKTQKELEDACPGECQGVVAAVWATVLVLTLLRSSFADEQDEWELVGSKAESWVKKQSLPANLTLDSLYSAAQKVLA